VTISGAIAETLWDRVSAYDLAEECMRLGMTPQDPDEDAPMSDKRRYVQRRLRKMSLEDVIRLAHE